MFNLNINFTQIIKDNLPFFLRWPLRINRIKALVSPFKFMHGEFLLRKADLFYQAHLNGSVIKLEQGLNDRFDNINRGIFISNFEFDKLWLYRKTEVKPAMILYRRWQSTINYVVGEFVWQSGIVYVCNTNCINKVPGVDPEWSTTTRKAPIIRRASNFNGTVAFVINVPSTLVFNLDEMKALVNRYKLAGPGYIIVTY